jgi:hypothetical protein
VAVTSRAAPHEVVLAGTGSSCLMHKSLVLRGTGWHSLQHVALLPVPVRPA